MLEQIKKRQFLEKVFGSGRLDGRQLNYSIKCPIPSCSSFGKGKYKLTFRLDDDRGQCWVCGWRGNIGSLLKKHEPHSFQEYINNYASRDGNWKNSVFNLNDEEDAPVELPKDFKLLAQHLDENNPYIRRAVRYLYGRGLTEKDLWFYKFGISLEPEYYRRVIMPSFSDTGELNFFTARSLDDNPYIKYLNCVADKKEIIFNEINIKWDKPLVLVEGPFDLTKAGDNAACLLGSELSESSRLFQQIILHNTPVILALDSDMPVKQQKFAKKLQQRDAQVSLASLGGHHDPGSMTREEFKTVINKAQRWGWESYIFTKMENAFSCSLKL